MGKSIFVWTAHPKDGSLCAALADAYQAGAERAGATVRRQDLWAMHVPDEGPGDGKDPLGPDLLRWQENVAWAQHLFLVHPCWWGTMPAKAKAVLDRGLTSGFGYKYRAKGLGWDKLLAGRTAEAVVTSDTPPLVDTLVYLGSGRRVLRKQVLGFCGIDVQRVLQFGPVRPAGAQTVARWLARAERLGERAAAARHAREEPALAREAA